MHEDTFWMVYIVGGQNPTIRHQTEIEARLEAARLARKTGKPAYVLQAIARGELLDIRWDNYDRPD